MIGLFTHCCTCQIFNQLTFNLLLIEIQQMTMVFIYGVREYDFYKQNKTLHCTPDFVTTFIYKAIANIQYIFYAMETIRIPYIFFALVVLKSLRSCVFFSLSFPKFTINVKCVHM